MDEYIKREDARLARPEWLELVDDFSAGFNVCIDEYIDKIDEIPAVDVVEVRHAHWIDTGSGQECSLCREIQYGYDNGRCYCQNCGARMDGEDNGTT